MFFSMVKEAHVDRNGVGGGSSELSHEELFLLECSQPCSDPCVKDKELSAEVVRRGCLSQHHSAARPDYRAGGGQAPGCRPPPGRRRKRDMAQTERVAPESVI